MITVTIVFDEKQGDGDTTPGALSVDIQDASAQELACLIADGVEILAEAMTKLANNYADDPAVVMLVMERMAHSNRFTVEEVDRGSKSFKPFFEE